MKELLVDLAAEHAELDAVVAPLDDGAWSTPTPAPGWGVIDQIIHLAFFDATAVMAVTDPKRFTAELEQAQADFESYMAKPHRSGLERGPEHTLELWRRNRGELLDAMAGIEPKARVPWYGPAMGARSFATARLMETWAHGQDIVDALGVERRPTDRLRHVAHLGVAARANSWVVRGLTPPSGDVRVELFGPGGDTWTWGGDDAGDSVKGSALHFCLLVTQRRHPDDTDLVAAGPVATEWLTLAQCFAGPPGAGREPGF